MGLLVLARVEYCSPKCRLFRCGKNASLYRQNGFWCRWTEEECEVSNCSFAICVKRRLLSKGICGETVKRKTIEKEPEDLGIPDLPDIDESEEPVEDEEFTIPDIPIDVEKEED